MSRGVWRQAGLLALSLLGFLARAVAAETVANYQIRGPGAILLWGVEQGMIDTELVVLAFHDLAPGQGDKPPPGPRLLFSVTRTTVSGATPIRRQWYGEAALKPGALVISPGLADARLEAKVSGTLVEQRSLGSVTRRKAQGTLKIQWKAISGPANTTMSLNRQTAPVTLQLNAVGEGRLGQATVSVRVEGLGGPIEEVGPGRLLSASNGTLALRLE